MSITMSMMSRLADSDHLNVFFLLERHFNSLGGGANRLLSVGVGADFVRDFFDGFSAYSAGDSVALVFVYDLLDGQFNIFADSFKGRHTSFSNFCHIDNSAVVFGFFVSIAMMSIGRGMMTISGGRLVIGRSRLVVSRFRVVNGFRFVWCRFGFVGRRGRFVIRRGWVFVMGVAMVVSVIYAMVRDLDE